MNGKYFQVSCEGELHTDKSIFFIQQETFVQPMEDFQQS